MRIPPQGTLHLARPVVRDGGVSDVEGRAVEQDAAAHAAVDGDVLEPQRNRAAGTRDRADTTCLQDDNLMSRA